MFYKSLVVSFLVCTLHLIRSQSSNQRTSGSNYGKSSGTEDDDVYRWILFYQRKTICMKTFLKDSWNSLVWPRLEDQYVLHDGRLRRSWPVLSSTRPRMSDQYWARSNRVGSDQSEDPHSHALLLWWEVQVLSQDGQDSSCRHCRKHIF